MKLAYLTFGFLASTAIARTTFVPSSDACDAKDVCELEKKSEWRGFDAKGTLRKRAPQTPPPQTPPPKTKPDPNHKKPPPPPPPKNGAPVPAPPPGKKKDPKAPKKKPPPPTDPCSTAYKLCTKPKDPKLGLDPTGKKYDDKQLEHKCGCALQACVGEDNARGRDYCAKLEKANWVDTDAGEKPPGRNMRTRSGGRDSQ